MGKSLVSEKKRQLLLSEMIATFRNESGKVDECFERLVRAEFAYYSARFDEAFNLAEQMLALDDEQDTIGGLHVRMNANIACGNFAEAYEDLCTLRGFCQKGFENFEDDPSFGIKLLCALSLENTILHDMFEYPPIDRSVAALSRGHKIYLGYLLALRAMRKGQFARAEGVAYSFKIIIGDGNVLSKTLLNLVVASTSIMNGEVREAVGYFDMAWRASKDFDLIMPFAELYFVLFGLPVKYFKEEGAGESGKADYRRIESLTRSFRKGWCGLRGKCGLLNYGEALTPLEGSIESLAAIGWRNKEIASFLGISENTVKHRLTSAYQKVGASKRSDIKQQFFEKNAHPPMFDK